MFVCVSCACIQTLMSVPESMTVSRHVPTTKAPLNAVANTDSISMIMERLVHVCALKMHSNLASCLNEEQFDWSMQLTILALEANHVLLGVQSLVEWRNVTALLVLSLLEILSV